MASRIEQVENKTLTGTDGHETYQRGNGGEEIPGTMTESVAAKNGDDVTLTIDRDVQWYVKKVLKEAESKYGTAWAIAVVQDVQSGEILALADSDEVQAGTDAAKMSRLGPCPKPSSLVRWARSSPCPAICRWDCIR